MSLGICICNKSRKLLAFALGMSKNKKPINSQN